MTDTLDSVDKAETCCCPFNTKEEGNAYGYQAASRALTREVPHNLFGDHCIKHLRPICSPQAGSVK